MWKVFSLQASLASVEVAASFILLRLENSSTDEATIVVGGENDVMTY